MNTADRRPPAPPRLPVYTRATRSRCPEIVIQARDVEILRQVGGYSKLRRDQIQRLCFGSEYTDSVKRRLRKLFHNGYLKREGQRFAQAVYSLDEKGARLLAETDGAAPPWRKRRKAVTDFFREHTLAIAEVRIALTRSAERHGWVVKRWVDDSEFRRQPYQYIEIDRLNARGEVVADQRTGQRSSERVAFIPDGYLELEAGEVTYHLYLEVDRSTMPGKRWMKKVQAYLGYRQEHFKKQHAQGTRVHVFRVMTVVLSQARLTSLLAATLGGGGTRSFPFITLNALNSADCLVEDIWHQPGEDGRVRLIGPVAGTEGDPGSGAAT